MGNCILFPQIVHFKSLLKSVKELLLWHEDQKELISSHSYFLCFFFLNLRNVIFIFFFFSQTVARMKRQSVFKCLHYISFTIQEIVCAQAFRGQITLRSKQNKYSEIVYLQFEGNVFKIKKKTFSKKRVCAQCQDGATLIQNLLPW